MRAGAPPHERRPRDIHVVERQDAVANRLRSLVTLARNEHEIARPRVAHRALDRLRAIDHGEPGYPSWDESALDVLDDS
jgi:hypothetical protein